MKYPFIFIGAAALVISFTALLLSSLYVILVSLLILAALCCIIVFGKSISLQNSVIITVALILMTTVSMLSINTRAKPAEKLDNSSARMSALLIEKPHFTETGTLYTFSGYHEGLGRNIKFSVWSDSLELSPGDRINADFYFKELDKTYKDSCLADGIYVSAKIENVTSVEEESSKLLRAVSAVRRYVKQTVSNTSKGDSAGILIALVTGDRDSVSNELYEASKVCGATHVMVVSGLHLGILCSILLKFMQKLKAKERLAVFSAFLLIILIIMVCDFHTSAIRAAVVCVITLSGSLIKRKANSLNSLGFAVSVMILFSPFLAGNVAFLLSVAATFGVIFVSPLILSATTRKTASGIIAKSWAVIYKVLVISVSALICTMPISVRYFGYFSLISPISSLLITSAVSVVLVLSTVSLMLSFIPILRLLSRTMLFITVLFGDYIAAVVSFLGRYRKFVVIVEPKLAPLCFLLSAALIAALWLLYKRKQLKGPDKR